MFVSARTRRIAVLYDVVPYLTAAFRASVFSLVRGFTGSWTLRKEKDDADELT